MKFTTKQYAHQVSYGIKGLNCGHCEQKVCDTLKAAGYGKARASATEGRLQIWSDQPILKEEVAQRVREAGFELLEEEAR